METKNSNLAKKKKAYKKRNKEYWDSLKHKNKTRTKLVNKNTGGKVMAFEIEKQPPSYRSNPDLELTLRRVEATINMMEPGQAFVVPSKSRHTIKKFIDENWPSLLFRYSKIKDNPGMMRIYYIKVS